MKLTKIVLESDDGEYELELTPKEAEELYNQLRTLFDRPLNTAPLFPNFPPDIIGPGTILC